jgi:tetratricopeptide (TPR) repeat protein
MDRLTFTPAEGTVSATTGGPRSKMGLSVPPAGGPSGALPGVLPGAPAPTLESPADPATRLSPAVAIAVNPAVPNGADPNLAAAAAIISSPPVAAAASLGRTDAGPAIVAIAEAPILLQRGLDRYSQGDFPMAIAYCTQAVALDPHLAAAWSVRSVLHYQQQQYPQALADAERVLALRPDATAYRVRGLLRQDRGEVDLAIEDYTAAIALHDQEADSYFYRGQAHLLRRDWAGAEADFSQALRLDPQLIEAYQQRSQARLMQFAQQGLAEPVEATCRHLVQEYGAAIALAPDLPVLYANRADLYEKLGHWAWALADWHGAIALAAQRLPASSDQSACSDPLGTSEQPAGPGQARLVQTQAEWLNWANSEGPEPREGPEPNVLLAQLLYRRGCLLQRQGLENNATTELQRALMHLPEPHASWQGKNSIAQAAAYRLWGEVQVRLGQYGSAKAAYDIALALDPSVGYGQRAQVLCYLGDRPAALADCDYGLTQTLADPHTPQTLALRGQLRFGMGDYGGAALDYRQAMQLDPLAAEYPFSLALLLSVVGQYETAIALLTRTLHLNANHGAAAYYRGVLHRYLDSSLRAERDFHLAQTCGPIDLTSAYEVYARSVAHYYWGHGAEAIADLQLAAQLCQRLQQQTLYQKATDFLATLVP